MSFPHDREPGFSLSTLVPLKTGNCSCEKCRELCLGRPGWFAPGEATKAAAELGLTLEAFFKQYLTLDYWCDATNGDIELLSPAWTPKYPPFVFVPPGQESNVGRRAAWGDAMVRGPCALLGPNGCRLSHENRPAECRWSYGCEDRSYRAQRVALVEQWKTQQAEVNAVRALIEGGE